jgi:hypothetical protein
MDKSPDIGRSLEGGFERFFTFLPQLLGAIIILIVGYILSKVIAKLLHRGLHRIGFDRALQNSPAGSVLSRVIDEPSRTAGRVVFWLLLFGFISFAVAALNLPVLNDILNGIYSYIPNIIAAIGIFLVASAISAGSAAFVQRVMAGSAAANIATAVIPVVTMSLALFMILNQLRIAEDIVNILFTAVVGAFAVGLALAFGLGGRDLARQLLEQAYNSAQANAGTVKSEVERARVNAKREARRAKAKGDL